MGVHDHEIGVVRDPADDEGDADDDHRLDDVPLDSPRLNLSRIRLQVAFTMSSHHLRLPSHDDHDVSVAIDEDHQRN